MTARKGILLAGGSGSRLHPVTAGVNKQLLPIYDKPMVYYPLSMLMLTGIREILIVTTPRDIDTYRTLLGDGSRWGLSLTFAEQAKPGGIAEGLLIGRNFLDGAPVALVLGDNIFYGHGLSDILRNTNAQQAGATVFGYWVSDPGRYGVLSFNDAGQPTGIVEKPTNPPSNWAVTGLYFMDEKAPDIAATMMPSARGELEIVDVLNAYLANGTLAVEKLGRGYAWLDTGTHDSLLQASQFVQTIEQRQGFKISCPEEIALRMGFIDVAQFESIAASYSNSTYGQYLARIAADWPDV